MPARGGRGGTGRRSASTKRTRPVIKSRKTGGGRKTIRPGFKTSAKRSRVSGSGFESLLNGMKMPTMIAAGVVAAGLLAGNLVHEEGLFVDEAIKEAAPVELRTRASFYTPEATLVQLIPVLDEVEESRLLTMDSYFAYDEQVTVARHNSDGQWRADRITYTDYADGWGERGGNRSDLDTYIEVNPDITPSEIRSILALRIGKARNIAEFNRYYNEAYYYVVEKQQEGNPKFVGPDGEDLIGISDWPYIGAFLSETMEGWPAVPRGGFETDRLSVEARAWYRKNNSALNSALGGSLHSADQLERPGYASAPFEISLRNSDGSIFVSPLASSTSLRPAFNPTQAESVRTSAGVLSFRLDEAYDDMPSYLSRYTGGVLGDLTAGAAIHNSHLSTIEMDRTAAAKTLMLAQFGFVLGGDDRLTPVVADPRFENEFGNLEDMVVVALGNYKLAQSVRIPNSVTGMRMSFDRGRQAVAEIFDPAGYDLQSGADLILYQMAGLGDSLRSGAFGPYKNDEVIDWADPEVVALFEEAADVSGAVILQWYADNARTLTEDTRLSRGVSADLLLNYQPGSNTLSRKTITAANDLLDQAERLRVHAGNLDDVQKQNVFLALAVGLETGAYATNRELALTAEPTVYATDDGSSSISAPSLAPR